MKDGKGFPPELLAFLTIFLVVMAIAMLIGLAISIFFCLTLQKALNRCRERNRQMAPGMVWLLMIPCFNIVWWYFVAIQVPGSLKLEFEDRGDDDGSDYGKAMGLTSAILLSVQVFMSCIPFVNYCTGVVAIIYVVFWIIFWVKIAGYSSQLGD